MHMHPDCMWPLIKGLTLLACVALSGCVGHRDALETEYREQASRDRAALLLRGTAALVSNSPSAESGTVPAEISAATAAAPGRVDIVWVEYVLCLRVHCKALDSVEGRLQQLDPGNAWVWMPELNRALDDNDPATVTTALEHIARSDRMTFYWNRLTVFVTDELGHARGANQPGATDHSLEERSTVAGALLSTAIPPLHPFALACQVDQLAEPGRRHACQAVTTRLVSSEEAITQAFGLSLQARLAKGDPRALDRVRGERRQLDYLMVESSRPRRFGQPDTALRLETARRTTSEADVMRAVLAARHKPLVPPSDWKSPIPDDQYQ